MGKFVGIPLAGRICYYYMLNNEFVDENYKENLNITEHVLSAHLYMPEPLPAKTRSGQTVACSLFSGKVEEL